MNFDINWVAGLVAGVAAMVPGSIIYAPPVLGRRWMKEIGVTEKQLKEGGGQGKAMGMIFASSLINGLVASIIVSTLKPSGIGGAVEISLLLGWFAVASSFMAVVFEHRTWAWFGITFLNSLITYSVIGIVLGLFL